MKSFSHPFKLVLLLLVAISMPLLEEARPLGVRECQNHDDRGSTMLSLPQTAKKPSNSGDAAVFGDDRLSAETLVASASLSSPADALAHSAPSPWRPLSRQPTNGAGQLLASSGPGPVGGTRKSPPPPPPAGPKPPHWQSSEQGGPRPRPRPLLVDVSDVLLGVLQRMVDGLGQSS